MGNWYKITNKADSAEIEIYDEIGKSWGKDDPTVSAKNFISELKKITADNINLHINSPGGSVFEGNTIYNALKAHKSKITVYVDGLAASIASVIAMAGDTIKMPENAMMMVHDPSGLVWGTAEDMRKMANALKKMKSGLVSAYHDKTGLDDEEISDLMSDETWFTAQEAVDMGFADEMLKPVEAQANISNMAQYYKNVPEQLTAGKSGKKQEVKNMTLEELKAESPDLYNTVFEAGHARGLAEGLEKNQAEAKTEGARAECERIKSVESQLMPGHEKLINELKFDGKTTGEQAAVKVLQAEKTLRVDAVANLESDKIDPVDTVKADETAKKDKPDFEQLVSDYQEKNNCSKGKSISAMARKHPKEHQEFINKSNS
jgi:ATP-dependent Clp endopeptidase proteolytic subunit ClpP